MDRVKRWVIQPTNNRVNQPTWLEQRSLGQRSGERLKGARLKEPQIRARPSTPAGGERPLKTGILNLHKI